MTTINGIKITKWRRAMYWAYRKLFPFFLGVPPSVFIQSYHNIEFGDGIWIASGVSILARNHKIDNPDEHDKVKKVKIGNYCWIGANAVILPGVELGDNTVIGAGSIVTKSFPKGNCVLVGSPAKKLYDF